MTGALVVGGVLLGGFVWWESRVSLPLVPLVFFRDRVRVTANLATLRDLAPLYEGIVYTAIHAVKADNVATFLGRRLSARYQGEAGTDFQVRLEGTRVKHHMGAAGSRSKA